jgi:hypothetical protein
MKKWFVAVLLLVLVGFLFIFYQFIPAKIGILQTETTEITQTAAFRVLSNESKWPKWWKDENGKSPADGAPLSYNGFDFKLVSRHAGVIGVEIAKGNFRLNSFITLIAFKYDSLLLLWRTDSLITGINPVARLAQFNRMKEIKECMKGILKNFRPYSVLPQNVYDCTIYRTSTDDTTMLCARYFTKEYPTTEVLYGYFDEVEKSIRKQKGFPISFPLMEIIQLKADSFETEVAIPTNVKLHDDGHVFYRRMEPGNFVATNVMGGTYSVSAAFDQLMNFTADYHRQIIAKPFKILVTDRRKEPDTLKWMTKIYIPVVE